LSRQDFRNLHIKRSARWDEKPNAVSDAIGYAKFRSRSHDAVIRIYDKAGNVIETYEHSGDFKEWWVKFFHRAVRLFLDNRDGRKKMLARSWAPASLHERWAPDASVGGHRCCAGAARLG